MSTGVQVNDECLHVYQELKLKKKYKYVVFKLSDDNKAIEVEKTVQECSDYDEFVASLPRDDCRYAVYDFEWDTQGEGVRNKICFYVWAPEQSRVKSKMLYAASKDALRRKLVGIGSEIQGTDLSEVAYDTVFERVTAGR
ncbi:hypothetical protein MIR68_009677 [Amoeboaphelidium protococcarum]|nr:hypothetical protein MIR68_009677 [Amoeboaphelidium protococcarum]KAI3646366.1 hypothetical protein MP228_009294 [Amoeboaphelidium protococcarum]